MKYIKRICNTFFFIICLISLLIASSSIFMPKNNMVNFGMEEVEANGILGEKSNTVDVLFLGDSESYTAFIPLQLWKDKGYTSYICGTSGQTLDYTSVMLGRAFSKQKPKIVVLETNAIYREQSEKKAFFTELSDYFSVFRYHDRWKNMGWNDLKKSADFTWTDDYKGFRHSTLIDQSEKTEHMKQTNEKEEIPEANQVSVHEIKQFCDENNAKLILISSPSTINWNYERHNGISELAADLGCEYIDMNLMTNEIPIDWNNDTRDKGDHLNYFGAKKVTTFMSSFLEDTGILTSHKDDIEYVKWDEALARFENVIPK